MKIYMIPFLFIFQFLPLNQSSEFSKASIIPTNYKNPKAKPFETANIVFKSTDGGQTWKDISEGLPKPESDNNRAGREICFANNSGIYLTTGNGLYHSKPGLTAPFWTKELIPEFSSITPAKTGIIAYNSQGVFQKLKGTDKWSSIFTTLRQKNIRSVFESEEGAVLVGSDDGLFRSTNNGKTWKKVYTAGVYHLVESRQVIMAISGRGIIRSTDNGENWDYVVHQERRGFLIESIENGFAVSLDKTATDTRSVRTSYDGGKSWQSIDAGLPESPSLSSIIQLGGNFFCGHPDGVFRSGDKGKTWKLVLPSIDGKVFKLSVSGNVIYAISRIRGC